MYRRYELASLRGDLVEIEEAESIVDDVLRRFGPWPDLCVLKATIDLTFHRLADVRRDLALAPGVAESRHGRALLADVALQDGRWKEARRGYESLIGIDRWWSDLARLAHLERQLGAFDVADQLYANAEDELSAKQMRCYAWVELQRGLLDLARGRYDEARGHYAQADRAYAGYWLVHQHHAGLLAVEGQMEEAVVVYEGLIERVARPELAQVLGEAYEHVGRRDAARSCRDRAHAAYLDSVERGQVHYFHHLAELADALDDGPEAVRWARADLHVRDDPQARAALAWALYRNGDPAAAVDEMRTALASGLTDARLFRRAAVVHEAAGRPEEAERLLRRASQINPRREHFHFHH